VSAGSAVFSQALVSALLLPSPSPARLSQFRSAASAPSGSASGSARWRHTTAQTRTARPSDRCGIAFKTVQATLPAYGSVEISCVFGQVGEEVWLTIDGKDYERSIWK